MSQVDKMRYKHLRKTEVSTKKIKQQKSVNIAHNSEAELGGEVQQIRLFSVQKKKPRTCITLTKNKLKMFKQ